MFYDDFSDPNSGWYTNETSTHKFSYQDGEYEAIHKVTWQTSSVGAPFSGAEHYSVEVDIRVINDGEGSFGIFFGRRNGWENYYLFRINDIQNYQLLEIEGDDWMTLIDWTYSDRIKKPSAVNHLLIKRRGSLIELYANGYLLTSLNDSTNLGNQTMGLHAATFGSGVPLIVRYDNFTVRQLTPP